MEAINNLRYTSRNRLDKHGTVQYSTVEQKTSPTDDRIVTIAVLCSRCSAKSPQALRSGSVLEAALEHRAFRLLEGVEARLGKDVAAGLSPSASWNRALLEVR